MRTPNEIERDYKKIRNLVDTTPVTSIKDIAEATNLSESEVKTSLAKHPRVLKEIMAKLEKNREELKAKKKAEKKVFETKSEDALDVKNEPEPNETQRKTEFVIDASISGIESLQEILSQICSSGAKIVLTSITIKELGKMQKFKDIDGIGASHILAMAAETPKSFLSVLIDENLATPDDCIVKYCADNKDRVILLTSDKEMAVNARMYGVETHYYKKNNNNPNNTKQAKSRSIKYNNFKTLTLFAAKKIGNQLLTYIVNNEYRKVLVLSNGIVYTEEGTYELKIGDDVYIATKKPEYLTFAHFQITSLLAENNCKLIYSKRIYDVADIKNMPKSAYKSFMRDFNSK